ncbi:MAG: hypothetical protein AAFY36_04930 [Bacteroidota bacterium]
MYSNYLTIILLIALNITSTNGQNSSWTKSVSPVVSFRFGEVSKSYEFIGQNDQIIHLEISEKLQSGIGFLYQLENENSTYLRLGIESFVLSRSNSINSALIQDGQLLILISGNSGRTFQLFTHMEYGRFFFNGLWGKLDIGLGLSASPFVDALSFEAVDAEEVNYQSASFGLAVGLNPRVALHLGDRLALDFTLLSRMLQLDFTNVNYEDPFLSSDASEIGGFNTDLTLDQLGLMVGLSFDL